MKNHVLVITLTMFALTACSEEPPRFGEATLSSAAPRATLTGTTWGQAPALELAPGCPGYLDPDVPAHAVHVRETLEVRIRATSDAGPLALAVARGDEVRCDSDDGTGHAPELTLTGEGTYLVYVASLRAPAELPYTLSVSAGGEPDVPADAADGTRDVTVTITSQPSGATVREPGGSVVGTTPAMFVVPVGAGDSIERSWVLELEDHETTTVTGRLITDAVVLHAQLSPSVIPATTTDSEAVAATSSRVDHSDAQRRPARPAVPAATRLPELPRHTEIVAVLAGLRPTIAQRCGAGGGNVRVYFELVGASGAARRITTSGTAAQTTQLCVAQIVRGARFPRFRRESIDVDYTYDLAVRPLPPALRHSPRGIVRPL